MRTIKFRMWDKTHKKMRSVSSLSFGDDGSAKTVLAWHKTEIGYDAALVIGECDLMQFTNTQDKNGKEVCEGDIVRLANGRIMQIIWHEKGFCWDTQPLNTVGSGVPFYALHYEDFEIIGNIYENSELLNTQA